MAYHKPHSNSIQSFWKYLDSDRLPSGDIYINEENGVMLRESSSDHNATHYGVTETSIPCDAYQMQENLDKSDLKQLVSRSASGNHQVSEEQHVLDREILTVDVSDQDNLPLVDNSVKYPSKCNTWRTFDCFDKAVYSLNKAKDINTLKEIYTCVKYMTLTPSEERTLRRIYTLRLNDVSASRLIKYYIEAMKKAYTVSYLIKVGQSIAKETILSENDKKILRAWFIQLRFEIGRK